MRSRWFHIPILHTPIEGYEKKASWLELFYDLIFVAAFIQLGNALSKHPDIPGFLGFAGLFVPLWVSWTGFSFYMNRYTVDDFVQRILVFIQMFAVGGMALSAPHLLDGHHKGFALSYAVAQGVVTLMYLRTWKQAEHGRAYCKFWGSVFGIAALFWLASVFIEPPWTYAFWGIGVACIFASPFSKQSRALMERYPIDYEHLSERYGLLTIIVLGESFVKVLTGLGEEGAALGTFFQAGLLLVLTCCIWWIYFDDVAGSHVRQERLMPIVWLYAHLPLQIAITASGVAIKKVVMIDNLTKPMKEEYRWLFAGTLGLTLLSVAIIDSVTERRQAELSDRARVSTRLFSAFLLLLLAPAGAAMSAGMLLALVATVCVAQVIFDMMMAPMEDVEAPHAVDSDTPGIGESEMQGMARPRRQPMAAAVRKGTPSELRHDLYFYFMEGGWLRFLGALLFLYLMINIFFACLYVITPGSIEHARPNSFADAFFFSVQTMSTIGYGTMTPATLHGHILVTIEAAVGLLGVALATGLMFAKVSRPIAKVLFSQPMVIMKRDQIPTLVFRCGNARGNEIVDASITVTIVKDEVTPEGFSMKRIYDLDLVRDRTPLFVLTWIVMHPITEDSPIHGIDWENDESIDTIVITLTGHDGTYGQTIYARHTYYREDIRPGHQFVDNTSELPDGRIMIDYGRFHDTEVQP